VAAEAPSELALSLCLIDGLSSAKHVKWRLPGCAFGFCTESTAESAISSTGNVGEKDLVGEELDKACVRERTVERAEDLGAGEALVESDSIRLMKKKKKMKETPKRMKERIEW
jgi:coenzyme F420-reducing hydrogenase beta subunit